MEFKWPNKQMRRRKKERAVLDAMCAPVPDDFHRRFGLTVRQERFVRVYDGTNMEDALRIAGYKKWHGNKLVVRKKIRDAMRFIWREEDPVMSKLIADRAARQQFWTDVMNDPNVDMPARLRASELLGRSEGDFISVVVPPGHAQSLRLAGPLAEKLIEVYNATRTLKVIDCDTGKAKHKKTGT
jgi:hypothetical protein